MSPPFVLLARIFYGLCVLGRGWRCVSSSRAWLLPGMARGNQRELARQKNLKKTQDQNKGKRKDDTMSAAQRKQRDSEIMQMKQRAANEKKSMQIGSQ